MTLSAALRGVVAQRLVKTLDNHAQVERKEVNSTESRWLKNNNIHRIKPTYPKFIHQQTNTDFKGVTPVMEIVLADHRVKKVIQQGEAAIYEAASRQPQFETLAQASERLAFAGRTTLDEARRLTSAQEAPVITNKRLGQVLVETSKISPENLEEFLTLQARERASGNAQGLGKFLVGAGLCTPQDITDAVGYTAEAQDVMQKLCLTDERRTELAALVRKWSAGVESLFSLAIASNLVTMEDLINETII
jgi:general secretion pathway protein E